MSVPGPQLPVPTGVTLPPETSRFPPTSRYYGIETTRLELPGRGTVVYLRRRFVPQPDRFATLSEAVVPPQDRIDRLAARLLGDPEQFWRLCDANRAMSGDELAGTPGRVVRVTLPEGIPTQPDE